MLLQLGEGLLEETFATLRHCGAGRNECVVYWTGPIDQPDLVDRVIHPDHVGEPGYYELEQDWLNVIWARLRGQRVEIRVQVHTHRGRAFHSRLDDDYPFLQTAGFRSLVIPRFGLGPVTVYGAHLVELTTEGRWRELDPHLSLVEIRP